MARPPDLPHPPQGRDLNPAPVSVVHRLVIPFGVASRNEVHLRALVKIDTLDRSTTVRSRPRSRTRIRLAVIAIALLASHLIIAITRQTSALAAGTCGTNGNYFDGWYEDPAKHSGPYVGASALITPQSLALCTGSTTNNIVAGWEMIADGVNGDYNYAQAGFIYIAHYYYPRWFSQMAHGAYLKSWYDPYDESAQLNSPRTFKTVYNYSCDCLKSEVGTDTVQISAFDPYTYWHYPWGPEFYGEAGYTASNMPGSSGYPTEFDQLRIQPEYAGSLYPMPCELAEYNDNPTHWGHGAPSCTDVHIYEIP
jgi:hypothetical protein